MEYDATYLGSKLSSLELNRSQLLSEMALSASDIVGVLSSDVSPLIAYRFQRHAVRSLCDDGRLLQSDAQSLQPVHGNQGTARGLEAADSSTVSVPSFLSFLPASPPSASPSLRTPSILSSRVCSSFTRASRAWRACCLPLASRSVPFPTFRFLLSPFPHYRSTGPCRVASSSLSHKEPEAIARRLATHVSHLQSVLNDTTQTLRFYTQTAQQHIETMTGNIPELFDDYYPPSVNTSLLQSDFQERSANFLSAISLAASNLRNDMQ